jgi:hypothetical protein
MRDIEAMGAATDSLVGRTQSAVSALHGIWQGFANQLDYVMQKAWQAMTYLDPRVRHSPSILDMVRAGTSDVNDVYAKQAETLLAYFERHYADQLAILKNYSKMAISYNKDAFGSIDPQSFKVVDGPPSAEVSTADMYAMFIEMQHIADILGKSSSVTGITPVQLLSAVTGTDQQAADSIPTTSYADVPAVDYSTALSSLPTSVAPSTADVVNAIAPTTQQGAGGGTMAGIAAVMANLVASIKGQVTAIAGAAPIINLNVGTVRSDTDLRTMIEATVREMQFVQARYTR